MTRYLLATGVVIMAALIGQSMRQSAVIAELRSDLSAAQSKVRGYEEYAKFITRLRAANATLDAVEKDLGDSDQPLSGYMLGVSQRMWP